MRELKQIETAPANFVRWLVPLRALAALLPWVSGAMALVAGIAVTLLWGNPYAERAKSLSRQLLQLSVIGLGAGMNLGIVGQVGLAGIGYTIVGLSATLLVGALVGRLLKVGRDVTTLISAGTAICGGSAIAAIAPAIRAKAHDIFRFSRRCFRPQRSDSPNFSRHRPRTAAQRAAVRALVRAGDPRHQFGRGRVNGVG
jgi:hypothetical protein